MGTEQIIDFIGIHKRRVIKKELASGTLDNFFLAIKLFCEMNDITTINWKRLMGFENPPTRLSNFIPGIRL
jgi:hypothetical protein